MPAFSVKRDKFRALKLPENVNFKRAISCKHNAPGRSQDGASLL